MAYTTINKSTDYFNTKLYTGNGSLPRAITGVGHQPDFVWLKDRDTAYNHQLYDSVRGTSAGVLYSNTNAVEDSAYQISSFDSDGFTLGSNLGAVNENNKKIVGWNWKAGTSVSGNTTGSGTYKSYTGSVNSTSKFSIIKYVGNGSAGHTIPHHLGQAPTFTIVKALGLTESWQVISSGLAADKFIQLDSTSAEVSQGSYNRFNSTRPSSTVVTLGSDDHTNKNDNNFIMYNFCNVDGFSKSGSYSGNGNVDGNFLYTGFKPLFFMQKRTDNAGNWAIFDNKRANPFNEITACLEANQSNVEQNNTGYNDVDFLSNGIKIREDNGDLNTNGGSYIYMAFGQSLVGSNNVPCTAR